MQRAELKYQIGSMDKEEILFPFLDGHLSVAVASVVTRKRPVRSGTVPQSFPNTGRT
jgi:hypothetical protein